MNKDDKRVRWMVFGAAALMVIIALVYLYKAMALWQ